MLRPPTDRPPSLRHLKSPPHIAFEEDCEQGLDALAHPDKKGSTIIRTRSFSGTFTSSNQPRGEEQQLKLPRPLVAAVLSLGLVVLLLGTASAWASALRAERSMAAVESNIQEIDLSVREIRASLHALTVLVHEQGAQYDEHRVQQAGRLEALQAAHNELTSKHLKADLPLALAGAVSPKLERLEAAVAAKPSTEQITSRLAQPITQLMQQMSAIERGMKASASAPPVPEPVSKPAAVSKPPSVSKPPAVSKPSRAEPRATGPPAGFVHVVFKFESSARASSMLLGTAEAAIYWLNGEKEVKYSQLPRDMRVMETTRPGECWRVRDAMTGTLLLKRYCATIEAEQEVAIQ